MASPNDKLKWATGFPGRPTNTAASVQVADDDDDDAQYLEPRPATPMALDGPNSKPYKPKPLNGGLALRDSVGHGGKNLPGDVRTVQIALNRVNDAGLMRSGQINDKTIEAIKAFQRKLGVSNPDGLVEVGGLAARKLNAGATVTPDKADKITTGSASHYQEQVTRTARDLSKQARINASKFARRVSSGCDDFVVFAKPKIEKLKKSEEARAQLLGLMAQGVFMAVGAGVVTHVEGKVAEYVADKIVDLLRDKIVEKTKDLATTSKEFEELVDKFIQRVKDRANAIEDLVGKAVDEHCDRIIDTLSHGEPLKKEDDDFISPFVFANITKEDQLLERRLGIPGAASTRKTQLNILNGLVKAFMTEYIKATVDGTTEGMAMNIRNSSPAEEAAVYAAKYTKNRAQHLDEVDNQVQAALEKKDKK